MQSPEFQTHLKDITDAALTVYFQQLNQTSSDADINYLNLVCPSLMSNNWQCNQMAETYQDRFGVANIKELKQLCKERFQNTIIYQIDNEMTRQILNYFDDEHFNDRTMLRYASLLDHSDFSKQVYHQHICFMHQINDGLDYTINEVVFNGLAGKSYRFDQFLNTL